MGSQADAKCEACLTSQFGGQTYIHVSHDGGIIRHWVNPKSICRLKRIIGTPPDANDASTSLI
jgi:hypothetical protein